jgi:hypothetical protein
VCHKRAKTGKAHQRPKLGRAHKGYEERKQVYLRGPSSVSGLFLFSLGLCSAKSALANAVLGCSGGHPSMLMSYPSNTMNLCPTELNCEAPTRGVEEEAARHASQQM